MDKYKDADDKVLVHDAYLEIHSDPEKYSEWQRRFIEDLEKNFRYNYVTTLSEKQKAQVLKILLEDNGEF